MAGVGLDLFEAEIGYGLPMALAATLIAVAVVATVVPARRASSITPVAALKE
jgi:ABC-type lipoprotein release transport system permease subunit